MSHKYNDNDIVKIARKPKRKDAGYHSDPGWNEFMNECVNCTGVVEGFAGYCDDDDEPKYWVRVNVKDDYEHDTLWVFRESWLEPTDKVITIVHKTGTNEVWATDGFISGLARCHPSDKFEYEVGAKLALERYFENFKLYSGAVVCVDDSTSHFTPGMVYAISDGEVVDDNGQVWTEIRQLENCLHGVTFIPFLGHR